ncbi:hypothetical protein D623_10009606 [Myotis brandtii]|uniref:Uncharacterized protein n=1 Tax=Myotis brandtii TaxID=109478 RepID=S7N426_MYOBR|nr:hypothetical protein D623_10009606 [Myotis brandtii]
MQRRPSEAVLGIARGSQKARVGALLTQVLAVVTAASRLLLMCSHRQFFLSPCDSRFFQGETIPALQDRSNLI